MDSRQYWDENGGGAVKYENYNSNDGYGRTADGNLNFASGANALASEDDGDYISTAYLKKGKVSRQQQDPMSHRIIEKRRRDRMNNCLADLSRLIPPHYCKKGRGRVEKTEIIEMAIRHLKYLQERNGGGEQQQEGPISVEHFRLGYQECRSEVMRYLVEGRGYPPTDSLCVHLIKHLNRHCDSILKGDQLNHPRSNPETTSTSSGGSGGSGGYDKPAPPAAAPPVYRSYAPPEDYATVQYYEDDAPPPPTARKDRDDFLDLSSYKFKNTIKQRFNQDCDEATDMTTAKRRRPDSSAPSLSSSNDEGVCPDASPSPAPADPPHSSPEPPPPHHRVPIFALNAPGKFYVPLTVSYESLAKFVPSDALSSGERVPSLHPVTINVNFHQGHLKEESAPARKWRPT